MSVRFLEAFWFVLDSAQMITVREGVAAGWANHLVFHVSANGGVVHLGIIALFGFERPGLNRPVNLAQVVDARIHLSGGTGFHEVWNRDGREQPDDGHDDHDFHQGESLLAGFLSFHTNLSVGAAWTKRWAVHY